MDDQSKCAQGHETLTLAWADQDERRSIVALSLREKRQTMNLRTMPGAELVVLRRIDGEFAGWAGVDIKSDPDHPELFSQFVFPQYRGLGLGALLEHFWWAYLNSHGCSTGFMRMEFDSNQSLLLHRLESGYYWEVPPENKTHFAATCRQCELFGTACVRQAYLAVDVRKALAASMRSRGDLHFDALPMRIELKDHHTSGAAEFAGHDLRKVNVDHHRFRGTEVC
jgi:GNAT superfamily N-acetyltransferase